MLDAQRTQAARADALIAEKPAVVVVHSLGSNDAYVARPIELRTNLAQLGGDVFVIVDELL